MPRKAKGFRPPKMGGSKMTKRALSRASAAAGKKMRQAARAKSRIRSGPVSAPKFKKAKMASAVRRPRVKRGR